MQYIEESLYEGGHCYANNIRDAFRCVFNEDQMKYTNKKKSFEEYTLRRFESAWGRSKKQLLPLGLWSCSPTRKLFIRQLVAELRMPSDWPPFGDDVVAVKLDVNCVCPVYVLYMFCICPVYVLYMSCICPVYVLYLSCICPVLYVLYMSCICPVYVLYIMSFLTYIYICVFTDSLLRRVHSLVQGDCTYWSKPI
jgi:hypothetical protein